MMASGTPKMNSGARIALISLYNRQFAFGLRYLSAVLKERGHHVDLVFFKQMTPNPDPTVSLEVGPGAGEEMYALPPTEKELEELIGLLKNLNADLIGISLISSFFHLAEETTRRIKESLNVPVIWGGPHPTLVPEECIGHADMVCVGEGEGAMVDLADRLAMGKDIADVENLWVRMANGSVVKNPLRPLITDLDSLPFPDQSDEDKYYIVEGVCSGEPPEEEEHGGTTYYLMSSRGCPFSCSFCCNSCFREIFKGKGPYVRRRSVSNVIDEVLEAMERRETKCVHFWDDVFTLNKRWIREFRDEWNRWVAVPFMCYAHPVYTDREIFGMLKDCGVKYVNIGIQSGSERTNREFFNRKRQKKEQIVEAARFLRDLGDIEVRYDVILDNPFEDDTDHMETLDLLLSLPAPFIMFTFSLCYFPKAEITERAVEKGFIAESDVEGNSSKAVEQYIFSLKKPRPKLNQFWNTLIGMTRYKFFPRAVIRRLSRKKLLDNHPGLLSFFVVRILKLVALKAKAVNLLRRTPGKRKVLEPPFALLPLKREASQRMLIPTTRIRNNLATPQTVLVCLDIYPMERPRHPERHVGFWGVNLELPPGDTELEVSFSDPKVRLRTEDKEFEPNEVWIGHLKEEGWYDVVLALRDPRRGRLSKEHRLFKKRTIRLHSSELFG